MSVLLRMEMNECRAKRERERERGTVRNEMLQHKSIAEQTDRQTNKTNAWKERKPAECKTLGMKLWKKKKQKKKKKKKKKKTYR
jgi:hypothetical protein